MDCSSFDLPVHANVESRQATVTLTDAKRGVECSIVRFCVERNHSLLFQAP